MPEAAPESSDCARFAAAARRSSSNPSSRPLDGRTMPASRSPLVPISGMTVTILTLPDRSRCSMALPTDPPIELLVLVDGHGTYAEWVDARTEYTIVEAEVGDS